MTLGFGVDVVIHEQAKRLVRRGYKVTVFTGWKTDLYDDPEYDLVCLRRGKEIACNLYSPEFMKQAFSVINQYRIDIWIIHTPPFYAWRYCLKSPAVMIEHGTPPGKFFGYRHGKYLDAQTRKRQRSVFRKIRSGDALIAISEYIKFGLPVDVQRSTVVIYNGADHYAKALKKTTHEFKQALGIAQSETLVLWVGRIQPVKDPQPYKGLQCLIRIAEKIKKENRHIRILAVGRGDHSVKPVLEKQGITVLLNQPSEKMPVIYAAADVFLNTSLWEGFNLPLVEAQYQGTPVIALKICAHPEVVSDGHSGILVQSLADLAKSVLCLADDKDRLKKMSEAAIWHASKFTWDDNVNKLETIINASLNLVEAKNSDDDDEQAQLKKTLGYYLDYCTYLNHHFGWKTLLREFHGFLKRRLPGAN
jgi:glycosyltransferase involved in cell wall biosynthesis